MNHGKQGSSTDTLAPHLTTPFFIYITGRMRLWTQLGGEWQNQKWSQRKGCRPQGSWYRGSLVSILLFAVLCLSSTVHGFGGVASVRQHFRINSSRVYMIKDSFNEEERVGDGDLDRPGKVIQDLSWRVAKLRLEEQNRRRFLKARPRYLPYDECRKWVQAWNRWENEQDWCVSSHWFIMYWVFCRSLSSSLIAYFVRSFVYTGSNGSIKEKSEIRTYQHDLMSIMVD